MFLQLCTDFILKTQLLKVPIICTDYPNFSVSHSAEESWSNNLFVQSRWYRWKKRSFLRLTEHGISSSLTYAAVPLHRDWLCNTNGYKCKGQQTKQWDLWQFARTDDPSVQLHDLPHTLYACNHTHISVHTHTCMYNTHTHTQRNKTYWEIPFPFQRRQQPQCPAKTTQNLVPQKKLAGGKSWVNWTNTTLEAGWSGLNVMHPLLSPPIPPLLHIWCDGFTPLCEGLSHSSPSHFVIWQGESIINISTLTVNSLYSTSNHSISENLVRKTWKKSITCSHSNTDMLKLCHHLI